MEAFGRALREKGLSYLIVGPFAIVLAFPFYVMLISAFKDQTEIYNAAQTPYWFSDNKPSWENGHQLFHETLYPTWLKNTAIVGVCVVAITLVLAVPAGYALARLAGRVGQSLGVGIFLTSLVPPTLLFLPLSQIMVGMGLYNSKWALAVVYPSFTIPFCTWLLMGFFKSIPKEITEAARVDGCSRLGALFRVILPISVPGLLTIVIFAFTLVMQEYIYGLTFVSASDEKLVTLGVVTDLIRGDIFFWGSLMAGALIVAIPVAVVYNLFMDTFVRGITGGAIK